MDTFSAIILGFVQGATEFLPVSSSGHLILSRLFFNITDESGLAFDAILQLATVCAVIVYFFDEIRILVQVVLRKLGRLPVNENDYTFVKALIIGTIPAVILGLCLESYMEHAFRNPILVAMVLIAGSVLFIMAEYHYQNCFQHRQIDVKKGFIVGLFQSLALIPGMSRSGATIAGGMFLGLSRSDATRFAFLLSVPIILGSGLKKLIELIKLETPIEWNTVVIGALVSFAVGLMAIHFMVSFVKKHTLWPFIWYRIILAGFVLFITIFG